KAARSLLAAELLHHPDDLGGILYGVDGRRREARMRGKPGDAHLPYAAALMADADAHGGRFADDAERRLDLHAGQPVDQAAHAGAADHLVIGDREVDRRLEIALREIRHKGEHQPDKALHVAGAAAVEAAVGLAQRERVARPVLAVDRNDVAVPGQDHTRPVRRADRRPQIGPGTVLVPDRVAGDAMARQIVFDIGDQATVRLARDGWAGPEIADHRHAFVAAGRSARAQCADFRLGVATIDMASSPLSRPRAPSRPW